MVEKAKSQWALLKRTTLLFVDEIHRFNKLQQDAFLPHVENGTIILIGARSAVVQIADWRFAGATTENPSFHVNSALLSRCKVRLPSSFR